MGKKSIYITLFTLLGVFFQFLILAGFEMWYVGKLLQNFDTYSFGWSWQEWVFYHNIVAGFLLVFGAGFGLWEGIYWFNRIYSGGRTFVSLENPFTAQFADLAFNETKLLRSNGDMSFASPMSAVYGFSVLPRVKSQTTIMKQEEEQRSSIFSSPIGSAMKKERINAEPPAGLPIGI